MPCLPQFFLHYVWCRKADKIFTCNHLFNFTLHLVLKICKKKKSAVLKLIFPILLTPQDSLKISDKLCFLYVKLEKLHGMYKVYYILYIKLEKLHGMYKVYYIYLLIFRIKTLEGLFAEVWQLIACIKFCQFFLHNTWC